MIHDYHVMWFVWA